MSLEEGVVLQGVLCALDVDGLQLVRRVFELEVDDVLGRDPEELGLGHAEEAVDVRRVARAHLEGPVDVRDAVGVAVDEAIDGDLLRVREASNEAAGRARRHPRELDQDALAGLPELVIVQALEHASRLDGEDELCVGLKLQVLDRVGDGVGARAEGGAVDADGLPRLSVSVDDDEVPRDGAAVLLGVVAELLAAEAL